LYNHFSFSMESPKPGLIGILFFFFATTTVKAQNIQAIEVRDSSFMMGADFHRAFYIDQYIVYQSRIHFTNSETTTRFDSATNEMIYDDSLISSGWKNRYFVFHRDSSFGYQYNPDKLWLTQRLAIDEARKLIGSTNDFDKLLSQKPDSVLLNADSSERQEVYLFPEKKDTPAIRIVLSYSKKLEHLKYSLNQIIDREKKMKLWKTDISIAPYYDKKAKANFPGGSFISEILELPPVVPEEVLFYLNWYKDLVQGHYKGS